MEQLKIPGFEKETYRFIIYYRDSYLTCKEVKVYPNEDETREFKQAWAIFYRIFPEIKQKGYRVSDVYKVI